MNPPRKTMAWAVWLDWERLDGVKRGRWYPAAEEVVTLFSTRREAKRMAGGFARVVRVEVRVR